MSGMRVPPALRPVTPYLPALAILLIQPILLPTGIGTWALGVVIGLLTALVALGLALIYRANRIINFAQGDLGTVPTTIAVGLIAVSGLPYLVGLVAGVGVAVLLGVVIEVFIVRRFFHGDQQVSGLAAFGACISFACHRKLDAFVHACRNVHIDRFFANCAEG